MTRKRFFGLISSIASIAIVVTILFLTVLIDMPMQAWGVISINVGVNTVNAAPPNEEEWTFAEARGGLIRATYFINTTTLKTSSFNFYNETTDIYAIPYVLYNGVEVWRVIIAPQSSSSIAYEAKFYRTPRNDPDDPDSIRYPKGFVFGMWTGSDPSRYP